MRRFRVDDLPASGELLLDRESSHHLLTVLRIRRGERVELFDGSGRAAQAELLGIEEDRAHMNLVETPRQLQPAGEAYLIIGIPKGQAMDAAVRMATEAGATVIQPVVTQRSVARGDRGERWTRIATSAAQQCGRAELPRVQPLCSLAEALDAVPSDIQRFVAMPGAKASVPPHRGAAILVGPEGGLTEREVALAQSKGWAPIALGPWVLRADTAAAIGISALVQRFEQRSED